MTTQVFTSAHLFAISMPFGISEVFVLIVRHWIDFVSKQFTLLTQFIYLKLNLYN